MRGIIELTLAIVILMGLGPKVLETSLREIKIMLAQKIQEQGRRGLRESTRKMTGGDRR